MGDRPLLARSDGPRHVPQATTTADGRRAQLDRRAADYARRMDGPTLR